MECWLATLDASSTIMSHALEQIHAAGIGVICKGAWIAPHFLLARLQGYSFQLAIQLACPAYILQLPSICVLLTDFKTFCWNKLGILTETSWHFSNISNDKSAPWAHESTSLDINKANGMLTSNAKMIMSHASERMNAAGIGVICKGAWIAPHFLLARLQGYSLPFVLK